MDDDFDVEYEMGLIEEQARKEKELLKIAEGLGAGRRNRPRKYIKSVDAEMPPNMADVETDDEDDDELDFSKIVGALPPTPTVDAMPLTSKISEDDLMGKRRMPMDDIFMKDAKCDARFYAQLQIKSDRINLNGREEQERYIKDLNVSKLAKEFNVTRPTFYTKLNKLIKNGFLIKENENGEVIYKLIITKGYYTLPSYSALKNMVSWANSDTIKTYLVCISYHKKYGQARLNQHQLLEQLGYPITRKYLTKIDDMIQELQEHEFIKVIEEKVIKIDGKKVKRYYISIQR